MKLIKFLFCLILCNWFTSVFAQTTISLNIKGQIIDVQNSPLPYVTVSLRSAKDSVSYKSGQSDNNGLFLIPNVVLGDYILSVSMVGFETLQQQLSVNRGQPLIDMGRLTLKSAVRVLNNVIVKAEPKLVEHQLDKTVVNIGRNVTTEGSTVWEVLHKLPGVRVSPDGQILLNGKPGVNVLIDGKTTYLSAEDLHGLLDGMQASGIQRVELMSNPSSKYDAAGTAGIINIVKKKNNKEGFNGNVNASLAQSYFGRYNGGFTFSYKNEHFNLLLNNTYTYNKRYSASNVISDIHDTGNKLLSEQVSDNSGNNIGRNYRPSLALDIYMFKRTIITISGTLSKGTTDNGFVSAMDVLDSLRNKVSHIYYRSKLHDSPFNYTAGIQLMHQLDTNGRLFTINADHAEYRYFPIQTNYSTLYDATGSFLSETNNLLLQHRQLDIYAAKMDYVRPLKNKSVFEAGIKSSYVKADNNNSVYDLADNRQIFDQTQSDHSINSEHINAAYINFNKNWPNISVEAGIRAEQTITKGKEIFTDATIERNYLQLFPTLFLSDHINEQNTLTLRLGRRTDRPDYHEYVPFRRPLTATLFFQGNPNLKPQTSWHGELGWNFLQSFIITLNYDIYRGYVRTLPFLDSNKTTITRRPINIQGAHGWETDLAYNKKVLSWWTTNNTLAVYSNAFSGQAFGAKLDNAGLVSLQFNTNNIFTISSLWSAECDYEYDTRRQYVNSVFGAYSLLDLGLKRSIFMGKGSLTLNANNILQSEDHNALDRNAGLYQVTNLHFYSRAVTLSFTYRFGTVKLSKIKIDSGAADEQRRAGN